MAILIDQITIGEVKYLALDSDPRTGGGYAAEVGSLATINNQGAPVGALYIKTGAGNTDWNIFGTEEANGSVGTGQARRLALFPTTDNLVDDVLTENSQPVTVDIVAQPTRTQPINYRIPNPGDAITAADFVLTQGAQTIAGAKTFSNDVVVNANLTVNGTLTNVNTVNLEVTDKLITLNNAGLADSGGDAGIEIEEANAVVAFFKTEAGATSDAWLLKAPDSQILTLDLSLLSAGRNHQFQNRDGVITLQTAAALTVGSIPFVDAGLRLAENNANLFWDNGNGRLGVGTNSPQEPLHVVGNGRFSGIGATLRLLAESDHTESQATVATTDATTTTLATIPVPTNSTMLVTVEMVGRRTGGSGGSNGDSATYIRTARLKNIGGTVTINNLQSDYTAEDTNGWNGTLDANGTNLRARVTGAANTNITWECHISRLVVD